MCVVACVRIYAVRMFYLSHARIILFLSSFFASDCVCHTCGTILCTSAYCRAPKNSTQQLQRTPLFFVSSLFAYAFACLLAFTYLLALLILCCMLPLCAATNLHRPPLLLPLFVFNFFVVAVFSLYFPWHAYH